MLQFFGVRGRLNFAMVTIWTTARHSNGSFLNASAAMSLSLRDLRGPTLPPSRGLALGLRPVGQHYVGNRV